MKKLQSISLRSLILFLSSLAALFYTKQQSNFAAPISPANSNSEVVQEPVSPKLIRANTKFGFKLFSQLLEKKGEQNIFISPSSIAIALAMTYNGAGGETQQAMAKTLELQGMTLAEINQANAALRTSIKNLDPQIQLTIANSLWGREGFDFKPEFLQRNRDFYDATVTNLNFNDPAAKSVINGWVKENTNGKIEQIVEKIEPESVLFLINAIYFKGNWTNEFSKDATEERPFTRLDGTQKQHPLMFQSGRYEYYENNLFQAASLPYGNQRLSMYVFVPKPKVGLKRFYENLNDQNWERWMSQFTRKQGSIGLPRFRLEDDLSLNDSLKALGMGVAFQNSADFSGMRSTPPSLAISNVKHKTFVDINEEGTEAAAATSVEMRVTSAMIEPEKPFRLVADRPFFFVIRDNQTGSNLFMGSVVAP